MMDSQKFTKKSLEAISQAQKVAIKNQNMQIEPEHLLLSLLTQDEGLIPKLFEKMDINLDSAIETVNSYILKIPKVTGSGKGPEKYIFQETWAKYFQKVKSNAKILKKTNIFLQSSMIKATENIVNMISNEEVPPQVRLNASKAVLEYGLKLTESIDILPRIEQLEKLQIDNKT